MKKILTIFAALLALGTAFSCQEVYPLADANGIPSASDLKIRHSIDASNVVSFYADNEGIIPYFIFDDGTTASGQGASKQYLNEGDYSVEVKAYNANGMSDGSIVYNFNVPTTYYLPFDATPFMNLLTGGSSKVWVLDSEAKGHMGCGESVTNPAGWWSANANEKEAWSVYDNTLTFNADGTFTFDPVDGQIYVNKGCSYHSELYLNDDQDYLAPCEVQNTTFTLSGITGVETKISFPQETTIGYIPDDAAWNNPEFVITELTVDKLVLVSVLDGICWQFIFKPLTSGPSTNDLLAGTWVLANEDKGHMGCGESVTNAAGWWSANADEKAAWSVYDNTLTFTADGHYTFDPVDGQIYVNKGCSYHSELYLNDDQDYLAPCEKQETTYEIADDGVTKRLIFPAQTTIGYIPDDATWNNPEFVITTLTEDRLILVNVLDGICWQFIFKREGGSAPVAPVAPDYDSEANLWKGADAAHTFEQYYANPDWSGRDNPVVSENAGTYSFTLPLAAENQWQAQFKILPVSLRTDSSKNYGLSVTVLSSTNVGGATVKLGSKTNENEEPSMFVGTLSLLGGIPQTYTFPTAVAGIDDEVELVFDFAPCPDNTSITISKIILWEVE